MAENSSLLGTARGVIEIDLSQLEKAAAAVQRISEQMTAAMNATSGRTASGGASTNTADAQLAGLVRVQEALRAVESTRTEQASKRLQVEQGLLSAQNQQALAARGFLNELQVIQQVESQRLNITQQQTSALQAQLAQAAAIRTAQEDPNSMIGRMRQGLGPERQSPMFPTFLQFSAFPFAGIAQSLGQQGLASGLYGAGSLIGIADTLPQMGKQITDLAGRLQSMGGVVGQVSNAAATAAAGLGATGAALTSVLAVAAPLALAIGAIALVMGEAARRADEARNATNSFVDGLIDARRRLLAGETTEEITNARATAQREVDARQSFLDEYRPLIEAYASAGGLNGLINLNPTATGVRAGFDAEANRLSGGEFTSIEALAEKFNSVQQEVAGFTNQIQNFDTALSSSQIALNDAAEAARLAADAENELSRARLEAGQRGRGMTNRDLESAISDAEQQYYAIARELESNTGISEEYRAELLAQQAALEAQAAVYEDLKNPLRDFILSLSNLPSTLETVAGGLFDLNQQLTENAAQAALDAARQAEDRRTAAEREAQDFDINRLRRYEDFNRQLEQSDADFAAAQLRRREDFEATIAELETEREDKRADLTEEFNREDARRAEDHAVRMARITRDGNRAIAEAAAALDAEGVYRSRQRMNDQLTDEQQDYERERARRLEDFALQLADLADAFEEQRDARLEAFEREQDDQAAQYAIQRQRRIDDFNRQLAREDADRATRRARQEQDYALQDARRQQDSARQLLQLITHNQTMYDIQRFWQGAMQGSWGSFLSNLASGMSGGSVLVPSTTFASSFAAFQRSQGVPGYASGTSRVPRDMLAVVHEGEVVLSKAVAAQYRRTLGDNFTQADALALANNGGAQGGTTMVRNYSFGDFYLDGALMREPDLGTLRRAIIQVIEAEAG